MDRSKELFTPDSIDDDIDFLLDESHFLFPDFNSQFIRELRSISQEDAASLNRVWERLEHYSKQQDAFQEPSFQIPQRQAADDCYIISFQKLEAEQPTKFSSTALHRARSCSYRPFLSQQSRLDLDYEILGYTSST